MSVQQWRFVAVSRFQTSMVLARRQVDTDVARDNKSSVIWWNFCRTGCYKCGYKIHFAVIRNNVSGRRIEHDVVVNVFSHNDVLVDFAVQIVWNHYKF